ncbi:efflux RND transporter periplasmic adaptor subunit [Thalassotalea sp. LPB0316]|uniref:efflux RND transporter periplasmic adaptor subunit n=1 Tax=Thalassotalea sp. LPB0316 TaxID=2769490 RepID=UPI0018669031|nr:efflux RND transporter periplasmic adaptor subunit [Thalassotalea sp. LPB0316]QOL26224.1 efflux RND transporter periplasmic adaptor subunit [Thalassotalea sp. LPB0316]
MSQVLKEQPTKPTAVKLTPNSGQTMDRKIAKTTTPYKKIIIGLLITTVAVGAGYHYLGNDTGKTLSLDNQRLNISTVKAGVFDDFIPIRTRVAPLKTVYLDAIEGGRVEQVLVEDGSVVTKGQPIVRLSNTQLQLDVMRNEAAVTEQLNNMRTIELSLEQNRLSHKRNLIEYNHEIKQLTRQLDRERVIRANGSISESQIQETEDELEYNKQMRELTLESQQTDARMQEQQLAFLKETNERLEASLAFARDNMNNLNMRAPVAGKLSGFDVEVGQSINRGERIGQIDDPDNFKLEASIDEYYLERIQLGQKASVSKSSETFMVAINKIYPDVKNGQFQVDLTFDGDQPDNIRRGQTLQAKLTLGDSAEVLLIPNGAFYQDTGGNWIFVVSPDGKTAVKRSVKLGRKNNQYIEVIEGLEANEKIITSPYSSFKSMDTLILTNN